MAKLGEKTPLWVKRKMSKTKAETRARRDFSKVKDYRQIHHWFRFFYGNPTKCENPICKRTSKWFEYARKHGRPHAVMRENYIVLCRQCHCLYDKQIQKCWKLDTKN
jgi:hypothetical protein